MSELLNEYGERMCACGHPFRQHVSGYCYGDFGRCECPQAHDRKESRE